MVRLMNNRSIGVLTYRCVHLLRYDLQARGLVLPRASLCDVTQQQRVSGEPLQRRHQQVAQLQPPALFVPLTPLGKGGGRGKKTG